MSRRPAGPDRFRPPGPGAPTTGISSSPASSSGRSEDFQSQFMYMFERLSEPLFYGPRGNKNAYYMFESSMMDDVTRKSATDIRRTLSQAAIVSEQSFNVTSPKVMPNLASIGNACKRSELFSYFLPSHRQAANEFTDILMAQKSREDFLSMCEVCRDDNNINSRLWVHAVVSSALQRKDVRGIKIPAIWEVMPDLFINASVRKLAQAQASIPMDGRVVLKINGGNGNAQRRGKSNMADVIVDASFTGRDENPENKLWYFREDLGVASHHWHWHVVYAGSAPKGSRDRKGELFYYMHHSMLARYDTERLCNGLARARVLDISTAPVLEEGYFPKLTSENSGQIWGGRQENTKLANVFRRNGDREFRVDIEDMRKWKDRILEAIDSGFIIDTDGRRVPLTPETGIDLLGSLVENGDKESLNAKFYGNMHNMGHVIVGFAHDPERRHNENIGAMGDEATAMKDPVFYRWHKFIDDLFDKFKQTLPAYTEADLSWRDVQVMEVEVATQGQAPNTLITNWMESDIDLTRGLDLRRSAMNQGPVWARVTHLNHEPFSYNITIENKVRDELQATVRIFMAPRLNEHGQRFPFDHQRILFFEMDKIFTTLTPGTNRISRSSAQSSVTIPWESSFRDLEKLMENGMLPEREAICGCGWPQHLLLPRGNAAGVVFDLFVMVTDGTKDVVGRSNAARPACKESLSFCGSLGEKYPDARPMGFPFDRAPRTLTKPGSNMAVTIQSLDEFLIKDGNMTSVQIKVVHQNTVRLRGNGAPPTTPVIEPERAIAKEGMANNSTNNNGLRPGGTAPNRGRSPIRVITNPPNRRPSSAHQVPPSSPGRGRIPSRPSEDDLGFYAYDTSPDRFSDES